ncbi:MAG: glycosyltransferase family 39 protein [Candidatus Binataceae bacterium]
MSVVYVVAVGALGALIFFYNLGAYGLWEPDEARYAEIAREMLALHDFVVPHLNYVPYVEKPPLLYWLTALSMRVFGLTEFGARLVDAVAAMAALLATYLFTLKAFDRRRALIAGAVLATSALYAVMAQVLTTDMLLTAMITVALFASYLHWRDGGAWCWLMYVAMGLGILTKGPVGAAIPILAGLVFLWWERSLGGALRRFHFIPGILLTSAIAAPWFIALTLRVPGYFEFYFIGENLRRFLQPGYSHGEPIYYYVPVIIAGFLPWTLTLPFIPWRRLAPSSARRFCVIAAAVIFVFFSLADAKLIPYVLPAFPPLAVLAADGLAGFADNRSEEPDSENALIDAPTRSLADPRRLAALGPLLGIIGAAVIAVAIHAADFRTPYVMMVHPALYAAGAIAIVAGAVCFALFWSRRFALGLFALVLATAAVFVTATYGRLMASPFRSYATLARTIEARAPDATLICYPRYMQSLPFYCRRRVILVGNKTELTFGAKHSADADRYFFATQADLLRLWRERSPVVLVLDRSVFPPLESRLGAYTVIATDRKKIAIMRGGVAAQSHATTRPIGLTRRPGNVSHEPRPSVK